MTTPDHQTAPGHQTAPDHQRTPQQRAGAGAQWQPASDAEQAMLGALIEDDRRRYFQVIATAPLYLPTFATDRQRATGQNFLTWDLMGHTYLLVFTSVPALAGAVRGLADGYTVTSYRELRAKWPSPQWRLAVNPGLPIDAWVEIDVVDQAAAGTRPVTAVADVIRARKPARDAAANAGLDAYLRRLLSAEVLVPTSEPVAADAGPQAELPWRLAPQYEQPTIEVFTSLEGLAAGCPPDVPCVRRQFSAVLASWPGDGYQLVLDPGSAVSFTLPGDRVPGLLLWSPEADADANGGAGPDTAAESARD